MKNRQNESGIRIHLVIPCDFLIPFLRGEEVHAWPTSPSSSCPAADPQNKADRRRYFPKGGTQIRVDADKVHIGEYLDGVFTIQRKGVVKRPVKKGAGQHRRAGSSQQDGEPKGEDMVFPIG